MADTARLEVTDDPGVWRRWLDDLGVEDLRWTPDLARAARHLDAGEACCARYRHAVGEEVLYPFLRRPVGSLADRCDLTSPYDFGGPLLLAEEPRQKALTVAFLERWRRWCRGEGVVSEFVRLDPLRFPPSVAAAIGAPFEEHQPHTVVELADGLEAVRSRYSASCRRNLRRGRARGVTVEPATGQPEAVEAFVRSYRETMIRVHAPRYYLFPRPYFEQLLALPGAHLFVARHSGEVAAAAAIFLGSGRNLYYFLGASDPEAWPLRPNNVLFDGVAGWAVQHGFLRLHLGGGAAPLRRFKGGFSSAQVPYYVLRAVYDPAAYDRLTAAVAPEIRKAVPGHFPAYRAAEFLPAGEG